jgi:hypothetical protein
MAQALFANQRETNLASTVSLIEEVLAELGYQPPTTRRVTLAGDPAPLHAWKIQKGSAIAIVALVPRPEFTHLRISAPILTLDAAVDRGALFAELLAQNDRLCGAAFALDGERVVLVSERSTLDLDRSELVDLITRVTTAADHHDDRLVARYGGTLGGDVT